MSRTMHLAFLVWMPTLPRFLQAFSLHPSFPCGTPFGLQLAGFEKYLGSKLQPKSGYCTGRSQNDSQGRSTQELPASHDQVGTRSTRDLEAVRNTHVSHCLLKNGWWTAHCCAAVPLPLVIKSIIQGLSLHGNSRHIEANSIRDLTSFDAQTHDPNAFIRQISVSEPTSTPVCFQPPRRKCARGQSPSQGFKPANDSIQHVIGAGPGTVYGLPSLSG